MEHRERRDAVTRDERRPVNLRAFVLSSTRDCDATVSELSYSGCKIQSAEQFAAGERFELRVVKRGAVQVEVRWAGERSAGARFLELTEQ
jgi:hypothetical protein